MPEQLATARNVILFQALVPHPAAIIRQGACAGSGTASESGSSVSNKRVIAPSAPRRRHRRGGRRGPRFLARLFGRRQRRSECHAPPVSRTPYSITATNASTIELQLAFRSRAGQHPGRDAVGPDKGGDGAGPAELNGSGAGI
jgi:hypothetical protein